MSYLEMIRELADSPTMDDGQAREWLRRMIDEKRRKAWSPGLACRDSSLAEEVD